MRHWLVVHKSLRGQSLDYSRDDFPRYYPERILDSTVISRIFLARRRASWQSSYQTRNFATLGISTIFNRLIRSTYTSSCPEDWTISSTLWRAVRRVVSEDSC